MFRLFLCSFIFLGGVSMTAQDKFETDIFKNSAGDLKITFIGHGSLLFNYKQQNIYIDPFGQLADFSLLPKADFIFITHQHQDHFDRVAIEKLLQANTQIFLSASCQPMPPSSQIIKNGERITLPGMTVSAIPAYNIVHKRENGLPFHPRAEGNGYIFAFADLLVYVAGDTEDIPEMAGLKNITVAFLPMNLPYTMTPEMTARAARSFKPRFLYPYHFGSTDPLLLAPLLAGESEITVRVRKMN